MATGYGTEVWATDSLVTGRVASGLSVVAQAAYRRQITPRGTLEGGEAEESYGIDLVGFVGSSNPDRIAAMLPSLIRGELTKDDRISDVFVSVTYATDSAGLAYFTIVERVVTFDGSESFELTIGVSALTIELIGLIV